MTLVVAPTSWPRSAKPQLDAAVLFFMRLHADGLQVAAVFWGLWLFPLAMLLWRLGGVRKLVAGARGHGRWRLCGGRHHGARAAQFEPQLRGWLRS